MAEWRPIPGYEHTYEVSDTGQINSKARPRTRGGLLKLKVNARGYWAVSLVAGGVQTTHEVHRLVALAFLGPRPPQAQVRHLDGDRLNCSAENLAYGTHSDNLLDAVRHGTHPTASRTHCPQGHEYTSENTRVTPSRPNARYCKACYR
ncbi:NUMOD4 motif-containing HNH endonuclease [Streptomyces sp. A0592]|uniref:NUMOD4 motif-containing HNH endonuclease n=1 Tax=Streptomyces sp. A0592 TaxID=2563099 RepID=UPI001447B353|nr:NUMOD4 motif-containing HNH endonuclease [Streptomyces sp. A0592]